MSAVKKVEAQAVTPIAMLQTAVEQGADIDKLEKLMNLQDRWEESNSKKAYNEALSRFQSELGPIVKKRKAHNSSYADMDDIAQAIRPILDKHGLSYSFNQNQQDSMLSVTCTVRHIAGHGESNTLTAPYDNSGGKNAIQAVASTVTYLRRYTLTGALGITTGNDDDDGGAPSLTADELLSYNELLRDLITEVYEIKLALANDDYSSAKETWRSLGESERNHLWRAPSKGGIFTTDERRKIKSDEWSKA